MSKLSFNKILLCAWLNFAAHSKVILSHCNSVSIRLPPSALHDLIILTAESVTTKAIHFRKNPKTSL